MRAAPLARQKIIEGGHQKPPKPSLVTIRQPKMVLGDHLSKELLGQILRLLRPVAFAAHISVNRIPVSTTKGFQRVLSRLRVPLASSGHHAPVCGGKDARRGVGWLR